MVMELWRRLRGARGIELFAALAIAALAALVLLGGGSRGAPEKTALEARLERALSGIDGAGTVSVMICEDEQGTAIGALIVANGLRDIRTYLSLQRAVMALLQLDADRIEIIGGPEGLWGGG